MKRRILTILIALCLIACLAPLSAFAVTETEGNNSRETAQAVNIGETIEGSISTSGQRDYYQITLTEPGTLTMDMTSYMRYFCIYIYGVDSGTELFSTEINEMDSNKGFLKKEYNVELSAATYYIQVSGYKYDSMNASTGNYELALSFDPTEVNEVEDNDNLAQSQLLELPASINGHFAVDDRLDSYKFVLPESGHLTIDVIYYFAAGEITIYNADAAELWNVTPTWNSDTGLMHATYDMHLTGGTYYIQFTSVLNTMSTYKACQGDYGFSLGFVGANATETEPNNAISEAEDIGLYDTVRGQIAMNDNLDFFEITVPVDRDITIDMTSYMRYYCLFIYDGSGNCLWKSEKNEWDSAVGFRSDCHTITLTAGTYYIRVFGNQSDGSYASSDGNYTFILNYIAPPVVKTSNVAVSGKNKLTWDAVEKAVKYRVYRSNAKNGSYKLIGTVTGTSYTDTTAQAEKTYYYKVTAVDAYNGTSKASAIVSRMCDLPRPVVTATNIAASGRNKLTWKTIDGAVKYQVYRSTKQNTGYIFQNTVTGTTWTDTTAKAGTKYFYKVVAVASKTNANSAKSAAVGRVCDCAQPVVKSINVAASGKIKLSWTKSEGAVKYRVSRSTAINGTYTVIANVTTLNYTDTTAQPGVKYFYKVVALSSNINGHSAASAVNARVCDLARPVVKTSNVAASGKNKVTWGAITGASKYQVYRSTSKTGTYKLVKTTTATSYTDTTAKPGTKYFYKVVAICGKNTNGNSAASTPIYRVCDCAQPNISVKKNVKGKPVLSWQSVAGATCYKVYRSTSKTGSYTLVKTATGTSWTDTTAKKGTTYYYKVMAICENTNGNSVYSNIVSIKP